MLNSIVSWALNMRVLIVAAALGLLFVGINATKNAPLDVFPEFAPPLVEVQTEAPGLSTEEVDSLVTVPLENSLNGLPFLKTIRSKSVLGLSSVVMIFHSGTDILKARQLVQERLNLAQNRLPAVMKPPVLMAPHSSLSRVIRIARCMRLVPSTGHPATQRVARVVLKRTPDERAKPSLVRRRTMEQVACEHDIREEALRHLVGKLRLESTLAQEANTGRTVDAREGIERLAARRFVGRCRTRDDRPAGVLEIGWHPFDCTSSA